MLGPRNSTESRIATGRHGERIHAGYRDFTVFRKSTRGGVALGASLRRYFVIDASGGETDILWGCSGAAARRAVREMFSFRFRDAWRRAGTCLTAGFCNSPGMTRKGRTPSTALSGRSRGACSLPIRIARRSTSISMPGPTAAEAIRLRSTLASRTSWITGDCAVLPRCGTRA